MNGAELRALAKDERIVEVGRRAIEDTLIDFRDERISIMGRGNGFVVREADGTDSSIIRIGTPEGLMLALRAMADALDAGAGS